MTHHVSTGHTADGVLTHVSHALEWGVDLYAGLEFWTFFQSQSQGIDLYSDRLIRGNIRYCLCRILLVKMQKQAK